MDLPRIHRSPRTNPRHDLIVETAVSAQIRQHLDTGITRDRYVPLHPDLIVLLTKWTADNVDHIRANRRLVADQYETINTTIDALYTDTLQLPADYETAGMAKLRRRTHARMLGNGL